jgi:preprotein translocase subunit SecG
VDGIKDSADKKNTAAARKVHLQSAPELEWTIIIFFVFFFFFIIVILISYLVSPSRTTVEISVKEERKENSRRNESEIARQMKRKQETS